MREIEEEIWKDIPEYEGRYQVSNLGRVKSLPRYTKNKVGMQLRREKVLKPGISVKGYYNVKLYKNNGKLNRTIPIHKLVAIAFLDNPNNYIEINHKDGIKSNNYYTNLEWCTRSHNVKETYSLGLRPENTYRGSGNRNSKLKEEQVLDIRERYSKEGVSLSKLAKEYEVVTSLIGMIINRQIWNHI